MQQSQPPLRSILKPIPNRFNSLTNKATSIANSIFYFFSSYLTTQTNSQQDLHNNQPTQENTLGRLRIRASDKLLRKAAKKKVFRYVESGEPFGEEPYNELGTIQGLPVTPASPAQKILTLSGPEVQVTVQPLQTSLLSKLKERDGCTPVIEKEREYIKEFEEEDSSVEENSIDDYQENDRIDQQFGRTKRRSSIVGISQFQVQNQPQLPQQSQKQSKKSTSQRILSSLSQQNKQSIKAYRAIKQKLPQHLKKYQQYISKQQSQITPTTNKSQQSQDCINRLHSKLENIRSRKEHKDKNKDKGAAKSDMFSDIRIQIKPKVLHLNLKNMVDALNTKSVQHHSTKDVQKGDDGHLPVFSVPTVVPNFGGFETSTSKLFSNVLKAAIPSLQPKQPKSDSIFGGIKLPQSTITPTLFNLQPTPTTNSDPPKQETSSNPPKQPPLLGVPSTTDSIFLKDTKLGLFDIKKQVQKSEQKKDTEDQVSKQKVQVTQTLPVDTNAQTPKQETKQETKPIEQVQAVNAQEDASPKVFENPFLKKMTSVPKDLLNDVIAKYKPNPIFGNPAAIPDVFKFAQKVPQPVSPAKPKQQSAQFSTPPKKPFPSSSIPQPQQDQSSMFDQSQQSASKVYPSQPINPAPIAGYNSSQAPNMASSSLSFSFLNPSQINEISNNDFLKTMPKVDIEKSMQLFGRPSGGIGYEAGSLFSVDDSFGKKKSDSRQGRKKKGCDRVFG